MKYLILAKRILFRAMNWKDYKDMYNFFLARYFPGKTISLEEMFSGDTTQPSDYDIRDWSLSGNDIAMLPDISKKGLYVFDQGQEYRTRNGCVPINIQSAHYNNHFDLQLTYEKVHANLDHWEGEKKWNEGWGANIPEIVNGYVKKWNLENPDNKIASARLHYKDPGLNDLLKKGYQVVGGRNVFPDYEKDKRDNRKMDSESYADMNRRAGHCQTIIQGTAINISNPNRKQFVYVTKKGNRNIDSTGLSDSIHAVNSYPQTAGIYNVYEHAILDKHCKNGIWFEWFYVIYPLNKAPMPTETKPTMTETDAAKAAALGIWNGKEGHLPATRLEVASMCYRVLTLCAKMIQDALKK